MNKIVCASLDNKCPGTMVFRIQVMTMHCYDGAREDAMQYIYYTLGSNCKAHSFLPTIVQYTWIIKSRALSLFPRLQLYNS